MWLRFEPLDSIIGAMFFKAGALSLALLLASRLLGLVRESAQAAAFGTSGLGDAAVLMLTLPDWLASLLASGALAYVLLPHWARQAPQAQATTQRAVALVLLGLGSTLGLLLWWGRDVAVAGLAAGLSDGLRPTAARALGWSALALPGALLAALWGTRAQHERDFGGLYGASLVVNVVLVAALLLIATSLHSALEIHYLGGFLVLAMGLRLAWLHWRRAVWRADTRAGQEPVSIHSLNGAPFPRASVWVWAALSAGLPLALPFVARSMASRGGEGALVTFNYAWKLVELPLILAIQLVASLALPAITRAFAQDALAAGLHGGKAGASAQAVRAAFALAWTLACAAAAGLLVGAPAIADLLFGWGRMAPQALATVAGWATVGAWGLLPQALIAVTLAVLAAQGRMRWAAGAYALALMVLLITGGWAAGDGGRLMAVLNVVLAGVALATLAALGPEAWHWLPRGLMLTTGAALCGVIAWQALVPVSGGSVLGGLVGAVVAALAVMATGWMAGSDLKLALRR